MMEVKTIDLIGPALDWAVAITDGWEPDRPQDGQLKKKWLGMEMHVIAGGGMSVSAGNRYSPSTDWMQGGPLIVECRVSVIFSDDDALPCAWTDNTGAKEHSSYLVAACRAIVAAKLGDVVSIPDELMR
jgi:hypothetical protein